MDFTHEWKSLWPVSSTFSPPLLISNKSQETPIGPLTFTPRPNSSTTILQSPSLSPRLPPPYPSLSLSHFLRICNSVPLAASSIPSVLGAEFSDDLSFIHAFNSLQLLRIPNRNQIVVFFPVGENSDTVGFLLLHVRDGTLRIHSLTEKLFHVAKESNSNRQRITLLLVNPVDVGEFLCDGTLGDVGNLNKPKTVMVGSLMVCTHFSVCWYGIEMSLVSGQKDYPVSLEFLGCVEAKNLRGNKIVSACWSPHLREECLVMLGNGDLLLFDVSSSFGENAGSRFSLGGNSRVVKKRMHVSLTDKLGLLNEGRDWLTCEFSWHPRILIAAHRTEVFLVDLRSTREHSIQSLLKLDILSDDEKDGFFALSKAGSDGFSFTVATKHLLLLCDARRPSMPVLRWSHCVLNPRYVKVFRLSDVRANAESAEYELASESGYCIMLGSFWDNEFSLFCYGPESIGDESLSSEISKMCYSYNAWGLPSELSLSDCCCKCGDCSIREEFTEMSRPVWVDRKHLALGFAVLVPDISSQLSSADRFGGFMLIRLASCGKVEVLPYRATWEPEKLIGHKRKSDFLEDNFLYDTNPMELEFEGVKKLQHIKLKYLGAFVRDRLENYIVGRREEIEGRGEGPGAADGPWDQSDWDLHKEICQKLKALGPLEEARGIQAALGDVTLPTSVREIGLMSLFAALPAGLMRPAFKIYSGLDVELGGNEPLEFLNIPDQPDQPRAPPFPFRRPSCRSSKFSTRFQPSDALIGPVVPPPFLVALYTRRVEELKRKRELHPEESTHVQLTTQCKKVLETVLEQMDETGEDDYVSLADDTENTTQKLKFSCHKPSAFSESHHSVEQWKHGPGSCIFSTHVFRKRELTKSNTCLDMLGKELFDAGCPVELKFEDSDVVFGPKELETFRNLKKREMDFQRSFKPYQEYINQRVL